MSEPDSDPDAFEAMPGHLVRRLQQIAVALFLDEAADAAITPVQFAALQAVARQAGMDQRTLAARIGLDTSTLGGVIDRLEKRALLRRVASEQDRRVRLLEITDEGRRLLRGLQGAVRKTQERILAPLDARQQQEFMRLLTTLVEGNKAYSRAPRSADD